MKIFNNKQVLITGGTGSFGKELTNLIIQSKVKIKKLIIFSRDEFKQSEMLKKFPEKKYPLLRYFIGDIRDYQSIKDTISGVDCIIHLAAGIWKNGVDMRVDKNIKVNIKTLEGKILEKSLRNLIK